MLLELGPLPAADVRGWTRVARRLICELRVEPSDLDGVITNDLLDGWSLLIDSWDKAADGDVFRYSGLIDTELAAYLLHGLDRVSQSDTARRLLTEQEIATHSEFTMGVVQSFIDGLGSEDSCHRHFVDQVRTTFGDRLDH